MIFIRQENANLKQENKKCRDEITKLNTEMMDSNPKDYRSYQEYPKTENKPEGMRSFTGIIRKNEEELIEYKD